MSFRLCQDARLLVSAPVVCITIFTAWKVLIINVRSLFWSWIILYGDTCCHRNIIMVSVKVLGGGIAAPSVRLPLAFFSYYEACNFVTWGRTRRRMHKHNPKMLRREELEDIQVSISTSTVSCKKIYTIWSSMPSALARCIIILFAVELQLFRAKWGLYSCSVEFFLGKYRDLLNFKTTVT